jgi:hypothetical protein
MSVTKEELIPSTRISWKKAEVERANKFINSFNSNQNSIILKYYNKNEIKKSFLDLLNVMKFMKHLKEYTKNFQKFQFSVIKILSKIYYFNDDANRILE